MLMRAWWHIVVRRHLEKQMSNRRDLVTIRVPGWLLRRYLLYAQAPAAFDYEPGVGVGTQESAQPVPGPGGDIP
jgi:hypothetical protein